MPALKLMHNGCSGFQQTRVYQPKFTQTYAYMNGAAMI